MLLRISKRINHRKRVISSALALIIIAGSIAGAFFNAPVAVYALSAGGIKSTIASLIISLLLQTGTAPVNQSYLDALNASYGYTIETAISEGLLTETAEGLIDTGLSAAIEGASAYSDLGLSDIFTTTAADGAGVIAGSGAVNIAKTAINVGTGGTIGAFAGAVAVGVGAGVLINHLRGYIGNYIKYGFPFSGSELKEVVNNVPEGYSRISYCIRKQWNVVYAQIFYTTNEMMSIGYIKDGQSRESLIARRDKGTPVTYSKNYQNSTFVSENNNNQSGKGPYFNYFSGNDLLEYKTDEMAASEAEAKIIRDRYQAGEINLPDVYSPDIIGPEGNQQYDNENDSYPGLENQIPEGSDMSPVDMTDYQNYVDNANNNTQNGDTGQETQGQDFNDFIDPYIVDIPTIPDQPIIPENPDEVPQVPDRPTVPEQPTIPDKPNIDQETLDKALEGATTIDLRAIFPFCIPFDIYNLVLIFDTGENRRAPHITFTFPLTDWVIDVDLAPFDPVAGILRLLELILFIVGLAVATRSLIGAGGG